MIRPTAPLPDAQVRVLMRAYRLRGDREAFRRVVEANIGLARKMAYRYHVSGVDVDDLFSEAMLGLIRGCELYDPDRGPRIETYAAWWMRARLLRYIMEQQGAVAFTGGSKERKLYHNIIRRLRRTAGAFDADEMAEELGVEASEIQTIGMRIGCQDVSLSANVADDDDEVKRIDLLVDCCASPEEHAIRQEEAAQVRRSVRQTLTLMTKRDREIARARLLSDEPPKLAELAHELGITRQRVQQIEARARDLLREALARHAA